VSVAPAAEYLRGVLQGRHVTGKNIQAKRDRIGTSARLPSFPNPVRSGNPTCIGSKVRELPSRSNPSPEHAEQFGLHSEELLSISSRKMVPPWDFETANAFAIAPVNAPFHVRTAHFQQPVGMAAQLQLDERLERRGLNLMARAMKFFSCTVSP